ncbi:unnamed protein product [Caenorhabditis brenneri]
MQKPTTYLPSFAPLESPSSSSVGAEPRVSGGVEQVEESLKLTPEQELEEYEYHIFKWRFVIADPTSKQILETEKMSFDWLAQKKPLAPKEVKHPTDLWFQTWGNSEEEKSVSSPMSYSNCDAWSERSSSPTELEASQPQENVLDIVGDFYDSEPQELNRQSEPLDRLVALVEPGIQPNPAPTLQETPQSDWSSRFKRVYQSARRCEENARKRMLAELNVRYEAALTKHTAWNTSYCWNHFTARGVPMYCNCETEDREQVTKWEEEYPPLFAPLVLKNVKDLALLTNPQLDLYYREWCHSYKANRETLVHFEMLERRKNDGFFNRLLEFEDENALKIEKIMAEIEREIGKRRSRGDWDRIIVN